MPDPISEFVIAACVPVGSSHSSGTLEQAEAILAANREIPSKDIFAATVLAEEATVRRFVAASPAIAIAKGGPYGWDALTYLCFSRYLRLAPERSQGFVRTTEALLAAGADANTGFFSEAHQPKPEFESALYGAAGVAHHAGVTRVLLEHGADPNDGEVAYHAPEGWDNAALKVLVDSGKLSTDTLSTMLLRKADWHDYEGIKLLLNHGANPNQLTHWGFAAIHQALRRDNALSNIELMLDRGANPELANRVDGRSVISTAVRRGRGDVLEALANRRIPARLEGVEQLIAACARNDEAAVREIVGRRPELVRELRASGANLIAEFAGNGNAKGVRPLLELGVDISASYAGDGYFDIARNSTSLHVAAWRARPAVVKLLIEYGAAVDAPDGCGRSPLALAVRACVDSYWRERRTPESVEALLHAGASVSGVKFPSGYRAVDDLLEAHAARPA